MSDTKTKSKSAVLEPLSWESVQPRVDELLAVTLTDENVDGWLHRWSDLMAQLYETRAQISRDVTENTADAEAEARFLVLVEEIMPRSQIAEQALKEKLLAFEGYQPAPENEQMLKRFRAEATIYRDENVPLHSELMKLANEYDKIVGAMTIEWDGQTLTVQQVESFLLDSDRETRHRAWRAILDCYLAQRERLDELYLKMLRLRRQVARNAGFDSFRDYQWLAMGRFDYTPEDAFTFHDAIEHEVVPLAREHYAWLRESLGVERLRPWDTKAEPTGKPLAPFKDAATLEEVGHRIFQRVDPALALHYEAMRDGFLDLASRPNKAPGGYCESFPVSGKPYIFMNAVGTHQDVSTLLHEGGHAFHYMESKRQPLVWHMNGPMEFCEVASMAMELLSAPYLAASEGGFYEEEEAKRAYRQQLLDNAVLFLPFMAVVDAFQHWIYSEAPEEVTAGELDTKWAELWDRYMEGIDYEGLQTEKETGWHRKGHIFWVPFYYIEYGLAQLGALQIWRNAQRDQPQAVADYRAALALGDTRPLPELFETAGATFAFDRKTVGELMALVDDRLTELRS